MGDEMTGVEVRRDGDRADVTLPGASGHRQPGERASLVDSVLDDDRVRHAHHVTVVVPRGDHEALLTAQDRLPGSTMRPAGASVIIESGDSLDGYAEGETSEG